MEVTQHRRGQTVQYNAVVVIDGESWLPCPLQGPDCFRVKADIGQWAQDAVDQHVALHRFQYECSTPWVYKSV